MVYVLYVGVYALLGGNKNNNIYFLLHEYCNVLIVTCTFYVY